MTRSHMEIARRALIYLVPLSNRLLLRSMVNAAFTIPR